MGRTMGRKHNTFHPQPTGQEYSLLTKPGILAKPLVKEATTPNGETYFPVFLPFDARVICPYCCKETSIATYAAHAKGPRMCEQYRRSVQVNSFPTNNFPTNIQVGNNATQDMLAAFAQFTQFMNQNMASSRALPSVRSERNESNERTQSNGNGSSNSSESEESPHDSPNGLCEYPF